MGPGDAVDDDLTYTIALFTLPPAWAMVTELPKPLPELSEISNPGGAAAVMLPVNLLPLTANCSNCGLTDAVPTQAEIAPVAVFATMAAVARLGSTVMVNVVGTPGQPEPCQIKFPTESGNCPTAIVDTTLPVDVSITNTDPPSKSFTYKKLPLSLKDTPSGDGVVAKLIVFTALFADIDN